MGRCLRPDEAESRVLELSDEHGRTVLGNLEAVDQIILCKPDCSRSVGAHEDSTAPVEHSGDTAAHSICCSIPFVSGASKGDVAFEGQIKCEMYHTYVYIILALLF